MYSSRKAWSAEDGTKHREDTKSFSWRTPVPSFSNHAEILLPEWGHFKHVLMQGILNASPSGPPNLATAWPKNSWGSSL